MADVSQRRLRPIQEAIGNEQWKAALQLCDKWHKKGEKSDQFQAARAYVLAKQSDASSATRGRDEIVKLCERKPAIADPEIIYQLQTALRDLKISNPGGGGPSLWERAAVGNPGEKDLGRAWLDDAVSQGDWKGAQKATMALRKSSPTDRNLEFWVILMNYIVSRDEAVPEKERLMFGTLAYRMLEKAAGGVAKEKQALSPGKAIQSPEELYLLVRVYLDTGHAQEARKLLTEESGLGSGSTIDKLDHALHRSLLIDVLQALQDWPTLLSELRLSLTSGSGWDAHDGRVMQTLLDAAQLEKSSFLSEFQDCIDEGLERAPQSRDLNYARLRLTQIQGAQADGSGLPLIEACEKYFKMGCKQLSCFEELRTPAASLSTDLQQRLIKLSQEEGDSHRSADASTIVALLNALKLEYCLQVSKASSVGTARGFASRVVEIYFKLSKSRDTPSSLTAQFAMLASMAVLKAGQGNDRSCGEIRTAYLQSCFILHYSSLKPGVEYQTQVVLLRLFALLGSLSMSSNLFHSLSIKNLQFESTGHLLLTRISTLYSVNRRGDTPIPDPASVIDKASSLNTKSFQTMQRRIMDGLEYKSYINVLDTIRLKDGLQHSFSQQLYQVEKARLNRLHGNFEPYDEVWSKGPYRDHRDYNCVPSFEHPKSRPFAAYLEIGSRPKEKWVRIMNICRLIVRTFHQEHNDSQSITATEIEILSSTILELDNLLKTADGELTAIESSSSRIYLELGKAWLRTHQSNQQDAEDSKTFTEAIAHIEEWLRSQATEFSKSPPPNLPGPSWQYLHTALSTLDTLITISLFLATDAKSPNSENKHNTKSKSSSKSKPKAKPSSSSHLSGMLTPTQSKTIKELITTTAKAIHSSARTLKHVLTDSAALDPLIDAVFARRDDQPGGAGDPEATTDTLGTHLSKLPDAQAVAEKLCSEIKDCWVQTLDGILKIEVDRG